MAYEVWVNTTMSIGTYRPWSRPWAGVRRRRNSTPPIAKSRCWTPGRPRRRASRIVQWRADWPPELSSDDSQGQRTRGPQTSHPCLRAPKLPRVAARRPSVPPFALREVARSTVALSQPVSRRHGSDSDERRSQNHSGRRGAPAQAPGRRTRVAGAVSTDRLPGASSTGSARPSRKTGSASSPSAARARAASTRP